MIDHGEAVGIPLYKIHLSPFWTEGYEEMEWLQTAGNTINSVGLHIAIGSLFLIVTGLFSFLVFQYRLIQLLLREQKAVRESLPARNPEYPRHKETPAT